MAETERPTSDRWALLQKRVLRARADDAPYLIRWTIFQTPWLGLKLHHILREDDAPDLHDHPWWFFSIVLRGWYREEIGLGVIPWDVPERRGRPLHAYRRVQWWNFKRATDGHRVDWLPPGGAWTLVLTGPTRRLWGFRKWEGDGWRWVPWFEYLGVADPRR